MKESRSFLNLISLAHRMNRFVLLAAAIFLAFIAFNRGYPPLKTVEAVRYEEWLKEAEDKMFSAAESAEPGASETSSSKSSKEVADGAKLAQSTNASLTLRIYKDRAERVYSLRAPGNTREMLRLLQLLREVDFFSLPQEVDNSDKPAKVEIRLQGMDGENFSRTVAASVLDKHAPGMLFLKLFELYASSNSTPQHLADVSNRG